MFKRIKSWLRNKFKSRAQRDRESGYYDRLPSVNGLDLDEINARMAGHKAFKVVSTGRPMSVCERFRTFRRRYGKWPNPKQLLAVLFPSEWLAEKLWPKWDPTMPNALVAPRAGYYDCDTGRVYDCNHKLIRTRHPGV
jgi:hypothetical protein